MRPVLARTHAATVATGADIDKAGDQLGEVLARTRSRRRAPRTSSSPLTRPTDLAKDAANVLLMEKDLDVLADGVAGGRRIFAYRRIPFFRSRPSMPLLLAALESPPSARCSRSRRRRTFWASRPCPGLAGDLRLWSRHRPGPDARIMTTEDRIKELEAQVKKLQAQQTALRKQLTQAQIDQWQGRIEDLEVQMHLGAMEVSDQLTARMDKLREKWADARRQFEESIATASSVADTVRTGLKNALDDLRKAVLESKNKLA
jgi:hypothetical protein